MEEVKNVKVQEIRIIAEERETKDGKKKFMSYKAVMKDGSLMDTRFTQAVKNAPESSCTIVVKAENANIDKNRLYPILWVKAIEEIKVIDTTQFSEANAKELEELFG